jgi:hypothetical protein
VCVPVTTRTNHIVITPISHIVHISHPFSHWIEDSFTLARLLTTASRNHEIHRNCSDPDEGLSLFRVGGFVAIVPVVSLPAATRGRWR